MSFYFSSIAPVLNSTRSYLASPAFKSHLFNAFVLLVCLIAFYISLVIDIFCYCYALAVNCFYYILDCQPLPSIEEREVDATVYLPLPTPIAGLLMPAPDRVLVTPHVHEDRVIVPLQAEITNVVPNKCVEFTYKGNQYRASLHRDEFGVSFLKWSYKATKRYMPIRDPLIAMANDYNAIVHQCYAALGI